MTAPPFGDVGLLLYDEISSEPAREGVDKESCIRSMKDKAAVYK